MMYINNVDWRNLTFIFYCFLVVLAALSTTLSNKYIRFRNKKWNISIIILSIILIFIRVFNTTGRDISDIGGYRYNFISATSLHNFMDQGLELGFKLLTVAIRQITADFNFYLVVVGVIYIFPIIYMFNKYKSKLDLFSSVLLYFTVFLFSSFSPIRQCLAASIGLLAFDKMIEKKTFQSFLFIIIAVLFHKSAIILFIPYLCVFLKILDRKLIILILISLFMALVFMRNNIFIFFSENSRYINYDVSGNGFGLEQIVYYVPIIALVLYCRKYIGSYYVKLNYSYVFSAFCFGMLGYIITIFGRVYLTYLPLVFIIGGNIKVLKRKKPQYKLLINLIVILYCCMRFWLYISRYYSLEDLMPYTNMLGWLI